MTGRYRMKAALMAALIWTGVPVASSADTLADALVGAYQHSGLLDQNRALLRAADENVAIAVSALRPVISWASSISRRLNSVSSPTSTRAQTLTSISVNAEFLLYDFGRTKYAIDSAKETVLATRENLRSVEQDVLLRAVRAFMNLQRERENVALRESNLRLLREELRAARDRFEVGEVTRTDVALAEARLASARSALEGSRGDFAAAREEYISVVGHAPGPLTPPRGLPKTAASQQAAVALAMQRHPDLRSAQHNVAVAEFNILQAEAEMKPRISANANLTVREDSPQFSAPRSGTVGIDATGTIYQGGRLSSIVRRAKAQRDSSRGVLHNTRHAIRQNVGVTWSRVAVARASLAASEEQIRASRVAFQGVREEAKLGARTTLDVLDAEQELLNARARKISATADLQIATYALLAAMGLLTAEHLKLPVAIYDPAQYYNLVKDAPVARSKQGKKLDRVLEALGKD